MAFMSKLWGVLQLGVIYIYITPAQVMSIFNGKQGMFGKGLD